MIYFGVDYDYIIILWTLFLKNKFYYKNSILNFSIDIGLPLILV